MYRKEIKDIIIKELNLNKNTNLYEQCKDRYSEIKKLYNSNIIKSIINYEISNKELEIAEKLYHVINNMYEVPKCLECNNKVKFKTFKLGYGKYCSRECVNNSKYIKEKRKQTNIEKYGTDSPLKNKNIQEKIKNTNLKRYGVKSTLQNKATKQKIKNTNLKRYGTENVFQSKEIQTKIKKTILNKYGVEYPIQNNIIKEKIKSTNLKKYGCANPSQNKQIKEKTKQTFIEKYGADNPSKNEKIKEKRKQTNLENGNNKDIVNKRKQTKFIKQYKQYYDKLSDNYEFLFSKEEYNGRGQLHKFKCKTCNNIFERNFYNLDKDLFKCPYCYPCYKSIGEQNIYNWLWSIINKEYIKINDRSVLDNKELDIYIPSKQFAIEYNGLYYHSIERNRIDKYYHYNKTEECNFLNIDLVHVFEDENIDVFKSIIYRRLNNIYGIRGEISNIRLVNNKNIIKGFIENNSLKEYVNCDYNLGYYYNNNLISTCSIKNNVINNYAIKNYWNIDTFNIFIKYINKKKLYYKLDRRFEFNNGYEIIKEIQPQLYKNDRFEIYDSGHYLLEI